MSWHDENNDDKQSRHRSNSVRLGGCGNVSHSSSSSGQPTTVRLPTKRNSISSNSSNPNHISSDEAEHSTDITSRNDKDESHHHPVQLTATVPVHTSVDVSKLKQQNDHTIVGEEHTMPPVKKKRGRPPLDDDFDSYSRPRIAHIESGTSKTYRQPAYDDHSDDHHPNTDPLSQPQSILEQSMEVQMDCDEEGVEHIIPKVERPDTPVSVKNDSYDENDYNPTSPKENESDAYDTGLSSQVNIFTSTMNQRRTQNNF